MKLFMHDYHCEILWTTSNEHTDYGSTWYWTIQQSDMLIACFEIVTLKTMAVQTIHGSELFCSQTCMTAYFTKLQNFDV
jgi:hypothetical protein